LTGVLTLTAGSLARTQTEGAPLLVFSSDRAHDYFTQLYAVGASGTPRDLTSEAEPEELVDVHGEQLTLVRHGAHPPVEVRPIDGRSAARQLVALPSGTSFVQGGWSPDGGELALGFELFRPPAISYQVELVARSGRVLARLSDALLKPVGLDVPGGSAAASWSADGTRLAYSLGPLGEALHTIRVVDAAGRLHFSARGTRATWARAAPIVALEDEQLHADTTALYTEQGRLLHRFGGELLALSPDGRSLVLGRAHPSGAYLVTATGSSYRLGLPGTALASFAPDGRHVELAGYGGPAVVVALPSRRRVASLARYGPWLPDGSGIAVASRGGVSIVGLDGRQRRRVAFPSWDAYVDPLAVTGGGTLVVQAESAVVHQLYERLASGELRQLTQGELDHQQPAVSADGRLIADVEYQTPCGNCEPREIGVLPADGSAPTRLLDGLGSDERSPSWSPDGRLAFGSYDPSRNGIVVAAADGTNPLSIATTEGRMDVAWSPDGSLIAASSVKTPDAPGGAGIIVMAPDGSGARSLTEPTDSDGLFPASPTWSPDSGRIAFLRKNGIYTVARDGSDPQLVLAMPRVTSVSWSPDGALLAFAACQPVPAGLEGCTNDIWTVHPDGSGITRVTHDVADDTTPTWLPASSSTR
jgi:Tol biopolymer transport system component